MCSPLRASPERSTAPWTNSSLKSRNLQRVSKQRESPSFGISGILPQRTPAYTRSLSSPHISQISTRSGRYLLPKLLERVAGGGRAERGVAADETPPLVSLCPRHRQHPRSPDTARMDVGARHLGMPDGMLTRRVGERLYWKIVITFQLREPRGGRQQLPHMRMPPPHFTVLYMRAPCDGYPFQTSQWPQPALVPHAILQKLEELMQPFGAHPPPHDVIKRDPRYGLLVEKGGTVHSLRTKIAAALASQPGRFHWSSTCDSRHSNVHCTAGLPAGVPDREGCVHFSNATLSKSLAPIAENLALHFALLGGRRQGDAGCEMTAFKVANLVAEADVPVSSAAECTWRRHVRGTACAG